MPPTISAQDRVRITVAQDGSGDYLTIQSAIDDCKSFPAQRIRIFVKNGVYGEKVTIHHWNTRITLSGESRDSTIISFGDYFGQIGRGRNSTFFTQTLHVQGNDFRMEHITVVNTAGAVGQAIAVSVEADRCSFEDCAIRGHQDSLYVAGEGFRQYFVECEIEGTTDFIFGSGTAVFENCRIHSLSSSYVTAASTFEGTLFGLVFLNCDFSAAPGIKDVFLGRPWRPFARTVLIDCHLGGHIHPQGWDNWGDPSSEQTAFYGESGSKGPGAAPKRRVAWSHSLSEEQILQYTPLNILGEWILRMGEE
ncbi:MAG: pectinesterase family protein [Bacteroidia bacterium]|nr:pectinesterase family protein [Bacteroidia bacterium]